MSTYKATEEDFKAVEEGIKMVWDPKLSYIFKDKDLINKAVIVSFDSYCIYLWMARKLINLNRIQCGLDKYFVYKIPHKLNIKEDDRKGWYAGIWPIEFNKFLPDEIKKSDFEIPKPCGSMLGDFISNQKKLKGIVNNPYITKESYIATIVHEFGHIYYGQYKLWWYSNKKENIEYLETALNLYLGKKTNKTKIRIPYPTFFSEVFAFCTEYSVSKIFWKNHKENLDKFAIELIKKSIEEEKMKDLENEDSVLQQNPHVNASVLGKILVEQFPKTWPQKILKQASRCSPLKILSLSP